MKGKNSMLEGGQWRRLLLLPFYIFAFLPFSASGNVLTERYNLSLLDLSNGLPHNNVSSLFTDSEGFLWVATYGGGLVRYDGYGMMQPLLGLKSNSCKSVTEDRFKRLWVAFDEGTNVINLRTMQPIAPELLGDEVSRLLSQPGVRVYCDVLGCVWLVTNTQVSLLTFDEVGSVEHVYTYPYKNNTPDICICDVEGNGCPWIGIDFGLYRLVEKNGKLEREEISSLLRPLFGLYITDIMKRGQVVWITTNHGLFRYDPYQHRLDSYRHGAKEGMLSHEFLSSLALMPDNTLLVGSLYGVNIYDDKTDAFTVWNSASLPPLKNDFVHCMMVDNGVIYVGTESGGIVRLVPRQLLLQTFVHSSDPGSLSPNAVNAMYADPDGNLWVGTVEGGLNCRQPGKSDFTHFMASNSALSHNSVSTLAADNRGRLWIGTWGGGVCLLDMKKSPYTITRLELPDEYARLTNFVGALAFDPINDGMWIGSNDGMFFYRFKTRQMEEPFEDCRIVRGCIGSIVTRDGQLWMGCMQGVRVVDLKSCHQGQFKSRGISHKLDDPDSPIIDKISAFCEAQDGTLWLGSNGYGLYRREVDKDGQEHFVALTQEDGLAYNGVKGIVEDRNGRLWITTQNGLSVYDPKVKAFTNYFSYDGLVDAHFYWNSAIKDAMGTIILGSEGGLIEVLGENADARQREHLVFTHLMVDNQDVLAGSPYLKEDISIAKTITLNEGNRSFSIEFTALNYGHEAQGVFSYRMKGFDKEWTQLKPGQHSVRYSALPVGDYTFEVTYRSAFSVEESDTISVDIVVVPYFWNSWWFRLLLSILFVGLVIYFYNQWVAELKRREAEQLLTPIRKVLEESENPTQLQSRIQNILDNQERYKMSVTKSVEADKEEVMKSTRPFMERVMEIMELNYMNSDFGVQEFCDKLGMSRTIASKHLNAEVGQPVGQFIRNYRLNMAREMLSSKTGNRNVTEVAYAVGFNDPKYFTRCFSKMYGTSPSTYDYKKQSLDIHQD